LAKSDKEIMEILEAFDLTRCAWSAAQLVGCDPQTVAAYVARRDAGLAPFSRLRRQRLVDPFLAKVEELVALPSQDSRRCGPPAAGGDGVRWGGAAEIAAPHPRRWCRGLRRSPARISAARSRAARQACRAAGGWVTARRRR
jgi:hypothetical protein